MNSTPKLRCGDQVTINPTNYKVISVDNHPQIKVFYSNTKVRTFEISECSIIKDLFNATLGVDNVQFVNSELKIKNSELKKRLKRLQHQNGLILAKNKKIKKDYNLPTQQELDTYYEAYKDSKQKDIVLYLNKLQLTEKSDLRQVVKNK